MIVRVSDDDPDIQALLSQTPYPRDHHYVFAHRLLPRMTFALSPKLELTRVAADLSFFRGIWTEVGSMVDEALPDDGLAATVVEDGELSVLVLSLPPAEVPAEAIMIAIVRQPIRRLLVFPGMQLRYFTLELGLALTDGFQIAGHRTVLCEWTKKGAHLNYGDGPPAEVGAFAAAVIEQCRSR